MSLLAPLVLAAVLALAPQGKDGTGAPPATPPTPPTPPTPGAPAAPAGTGEYRAELSSGGATLVYRVVPTQLTVAQRVQVQLTVEAPAGWSVSWPAVGEKLGRATVVDTADNREGLKQTRTITLEPYLPGDDTIPALSVSVSPRDPQAGAAPVTLTTMPVPLAIRALIGEGDTQNPFEAELRDARSPEEAGWLWKYWNALRPRTRARIRNGALFGGVFVVAGVVALIVRRKPEPVDDHAGTALARLDALAAGPAASSHAARDAALDQIGAAARDFLQARGVASAVGASTPELASRLPASNPGTPRIVELLSGVDSARFDPRNQTQAPGPLAAQLAAVLRSTFAPAVQAVGGAGA